MPGIRGVVTSLLKLLNLYFFSTLDYPPLPLRRHLTKLPGIKMPPEEKNKAYFKESTLLQKLYGDAFRQVPIVRANWLIKAAYLNSQMRDKSIQWAKYLVLFIKVWFLLFLFI